MHDILKPPVNILYFIVPILYIVKLNTISFIISTLIPSRLEKIKVEKFNSEFLKMLSLTLFTFAVY